VLSPNDEALLNDLLDDRLGAAEEAALTARMEREPALRDAWDELVRARELVRDVPDPVPPSDFTARVRARLAATPAADDGAPLPGEAVGVPTPVVPLFWRRMMTVAYAAAAALILGIGALALKDRTAAPAARDHTVASAREGELSREPKRDKGPGAKADPLAEAVPRLEADAEENDPGNAVPPPATPSVAETAETAPLEGFAAESPRADERGAGAPPPAVAGPAIGPGGQGPRGQPSDSRASTPEGAAAPPSGPAPVAPPSRPRSAGAPRPDPAKGERAALPPAPAAGTLPVDPALGELLVLEAATLEAGRALLDSVVAGPSARAWGGAEEPAGQGSTVRSTRVSLRRLDLRLDGGLLAAAKLIDRPGASAAKPKQAPAAPAAAPPAPAPPPYRQPGSGPDGASAPVPLPAPAPSAAPPSSPPTTPPVPAGGAPGTLLGVEPRTLTAEEYGRLVALLGPEDAKAREAKSAKKDEAGHRIRVLIVRTAR
jgi:hypothetical protein